MDQIQYVFCVLVRMVNLWSTQNCHLLLVTVKWSIYSKNNSRLKLPIQSGWSGIIILWQPCRNVQVHWVEHIAITEEVHSVGHPQMNVSGKVVSRKCIYLCALVEIHSAAIKRSILFHGMESQFAVQNMQVVLKPYKA